MSRFHRFVGFALTLVLTGTLLEAAPVSAEEASEPTAVTEPEPPPPAVLPDPEPPIPTGFVEGVSVRDESATTPYRVEYDNPDGTRTAVITPGLSRFEDYEGDWHDTDYSLEETNDSTWVAASAVDSPEISQRSQGQIVDFPAEPGLSLGFVGAADVEGVLVDDDHVVEYPAALSGGRDVQLSLVTGGVEHQVIVPNREAGAAYELNMTLPASGSAVEVDTGVNVLDGVGAMVGGLYDGYARDSAENPSTAAVTVGVVSQTASAARVAASIDPAWFADPARVFPIIIDPTTYQSSTTWGALGMYPDDCPYSFDRYSSCDTFVSAPNPSTTWHKAHDVRSGYGSGGQDRAMLQFPMDSMGTAGHQYWVMSSTVEIYNNYSAGPAGQTKVFELHPLTGPVVRTTNWNNQPPIDWASETYANIGRDSYGNSTGWVAFDNTATAQRWMNGTLQAYGVAITAQNEYGADTWRTFYSAEGDSTRAPKMSLTYNRPPTAATLVSPANGATVTTASPTLSASASDPDGDPVQFYFEVATGPDFANIVVRSGWVGSSWTVPAGGINSNGTYYWRAHTSDGYQNTGPNTYRSIYVDVPPPPPPGTPVISSSSHPNSALTYDSPDLVTSWTTTGQAIDGYSVVIDRLAATTPDTVSDQTHNSKTFTNLDDGTHYVHVRARNAGGWGPAGHFKANVATITATSDGLGREQFYPYDAKDLGTATAYVGLHNGNLVVSQDDGKIPGEGLSIVARRTYNSQSTVDAGMGPGWSLSLADVDAGLENLDVVDESGGSAAFGSLEPDVSMIVSDLRNAANTVVGRVLDLIDADGTSHKFLRRSTTVGARWDSPPGVSLRVREVTNAGVVVAYQLVRPDGVTTTAENLQTPLGLSTPAWRVTKIADRNGNELTYGYVGLDLVSGGVTVKTPRLSTIRHNRTGAEILVQLSWSPGGQLSSLELLPETDRRVTQFDYVAGKLTSVAENAHTTVEGGQRTTEFAYDPATGLLASVKDARGSTSAFDYTTTGNVHRLTSMVDRRAKTWRWHYGAPHATTGDSVTVATSPIGPAATTAGDESSPQEGQTAYRISPKARIDLNDRRQAGPNIRAITTAGTGSGPTSRTYGWYANRLTTITDGAGNATSMTYNDLGLLRSVTEPSPNDPATPNLPADAPTTGITTTFEYQYPAAHRYSTSYCANPAANSTPVSNEGWCYAVADMTRTVAATNVAAQRRITEFAYDAAGNVTRQLQRAASNPIPALGAPVAAPDRATTMTYYSKGALRTVDGARTDVADITTFGNTADTAYGGYDRTGQPLTITDARSKVTTFAYNAYGMVTSTTDRDNQTSAATYDARDNRLTVTDPAGSTWAEAWDPNDNPLTRTQARGTATGDSDDFQERFVHDNNDWLTAASTPGADEAAARPTTQYAYNDDGTRASTTSPSAATTLNAFWPDRSLKRTTAPAGSSTTAVTDWTYDTVGRVSTETASAVNAAGSRPVAKMFYTPDGQVARTETTNSTGGWSVARSIFNAHGERISTRGPRTFNGVEEESTTGFDVFGQQVAAGRRLSASKVISTYYGYDATGNQVCTAQPTGTAGQSPTACSGGAATAGGQLVARYGYDVLGRLAAQTVDPVNTPHTVSYSYSDGGEQISRVDNVSGAPRRTTMTAFNPDNTLQTRHVIDHSTGKTLTTCYTEPGQAVDSGYDADKNVRSVETRVGSTSSCTGGTRLAWDSYTRDHRGMLSAATKRVLHPAAGSAEVARAQSFTYRADGQLASRTDAGRTTNFVHSPGGQLERVNAWGLQTTMVNAASGARVRECRKSPTWACAAADADLLWNYHADGSLSSLEAFARPGGGARVPARTHAGVAYDAGGFRTAETVTAPQPTGSAGTIGGFQALYGHDLAGRLISWTSPFARADTARETDNMTLDDGGNTMTTNTTAAEGSNTEVATSTLEAGRLASRVTDATDTLGTTRTNESFSYSPFGEETSRSTTVTPPPNLGAPVSETTTTTYDPAGYTASSTTGSTTVSYTYDPVTERVLTRSEGTTHVIYWSWGDGAEVAAETNSAGTFPTLYLNDDRGNAIASENPAGHKTWLLPDSEGNQTTTVDDNGVLLSQKSFRPYGSVEARGSGNRTGTAGSPSSMGFQAAITDRTTGGVLVGPRQYDPKIERFTNPDAYINGLEDLGLGTDELTGNRYLFAAGNPTLYYEDGHRPCRGNRFQRFGCAAVRFVAKHKVDIALTAVSFVPVAGQASWAYRGARALTALRTLRAARIARTASTARAIPSSATQGARLRKYLEMAEEYGKDGVRELADGRIRFYGKLTPARKQGEMAGGRLAREWNPATGRERAWYETLDHAGRVRQVHPYQPRSPYHYMFDSSGKYAGRW